MRAEQVFALNVRAPWAQLIVVGEKRLEVRDYDTRYRGPLVIVSSLTRPTQAMLERAGVSSRAAEGYLYGHAIGLVDLVDSRPARASDARLARCDVGRGQFVWVMANPRPIQPFAQPGRCKPYRIDAAKITLA